MTATTARPFAIPESRTNPRRLLERLLDGTDDNAAYAAATAPSSSMSCSGEAIA